MICFIAGKGRERERGRGRDPPKINTRYPADENI